MSLGPRRSSRALHRLLLDAPVLVLALGLLVPIVLLWGQRMFHPFDLEWMEGGMLGHAWRIRQGLSLYDAPVTEFVPYVYPPGYAAILAALATFFPLDYPLARCISLLGSLAAAGAIVWSGARQFRDPRMGILGGILFLLCYGGSGAFYDLARVDGLAMGLLAWAIVLGAERSPRALHSSAILLIAVFFVKHAYALFGFPIAIGIWARDGWRKALRFGLTAAIPALLATLWLNRVTHGGFLAYVLDVPRAHPILRHQAFPGSFGELALLLGIAWFTAIVAIIAKSLRSGLFPMVCLGAPLLCATFFMTLEPGLVWPVGVGLLDDSIRYITLALVGASAGAVVVLKIAFLQSKTWPWPWVYGVAVGFCALFVASLMRGHQGGFTNVLMPAHWTLVAGITAAFAHVRRVNSGRWPHLICSAAWALQAIWAFERIDFERLSPKAEDVAIGQRLLEEVRHCQGPVLSPFAAWLPVQAGFAPSTHLIAIWDIDHPTGPRKYLVDEFDAAIRNHHWGCIIDGGPPPLGHDANAAYPVVVPLEIPSEAFFPSTGWRARPRVIRKASP